MHAGRAGKGRAKGETGIIGQESSQAGRAEQACRQAG
jgi:hypothetical protein